nr:immunoglobulin light chain junction region [Macaca mulatta]MPN65865.1 immunoglobulin light chain junction region [Macaca mulatta]MPN65874.1 immunoglobulin light chain junction region [Macaca mulatta]MPN68666.1 immunoglobulin light chain junction region [Macaca mulatta]
CASGHSSGDVF